MAAERSRASDTRVRSVVEPVVDAAGLYLEDVHATRAGDRSVVRITLDLPEHVEGELDSDRLAEASRSISAVLDEADVVPGRYTLEVSTPGATRPLTRARHFRRARGRLVRLTTTDGDEVRGRLRDVVGEGDDVELVLADGTRLPRSAVRRCKVEVELTRLGDDDAGAAREGEEG